jgi:acetolactate synthase-1/3 small subunit
MQCIHTIQVYKESLIQTMPMKTKKHIITMLVQNEPGVTARISSLFAGRGYNIETICGAPTANPKMSRITISIKASAAQLAQIFKYLRRLVNVIKVRDMTGSRAVQSEVALICVKALTKNRPEINKLVKRYKAKVVDKGLTHYIIEITGAQEKIDDLIRRLEPIGIKKLTRSGVLALYREPK